MKNCENNRECEKGVREKILDAATRLFAEKGYHGTSMKEVAKLAGVNKALLFYYFNSKENMHRELLSDMPSFLKITIKEELEKASDSLKKLEAVVLALVKHFSRSRFRMKILLQSFLGLGPEPPVLHDEMINLTRLPLVNVLEEGIKEGKFRPVDSNFMANGIIGMLQIFYRIPSHSEVEYSNEEIFKNVITIIENGILTGETTDEED